MKEIEIQNRINVRNLIIFFLIGIVGIINGVRDFALYQIPISKIAFPDPVIYKNVVVLNNNAFESMTVANSVGFVPSLVILGVFVIVIMFMFSITAGVCMKGD